MEIKKELLSILNGFKYAETINPVIRMTYFSYADNEMLLDTTCLSIKEAEKLIASQYTEEGFSDDDGELCIYVNGIKKSFNLYAKIDI